jgi:spoIIIJ-associated protein
MADSKTAQKKFTVASVGEKISKFLDLVKDRGKFNFKYRLTDDETPHPDFENPDLMVKFSGPDVEILLENKAELLLALEQLTSEVLRMGSDEHTRLCFDANDYRMLRVAELRLSATTAAEKVKKSHMPFHFSPMNSRERRIIHLALRNEPEVRSESAGMAPHRNVVIYPADMPSAPATGQPSFAMRRRRR